MSGYGSYYLRDNPFPETAVIDPSSPDIRLNGSIFHEGIFSREIEALRKKTDQGVTVVYIAGFKFVRGTGKSALMINHLMRMREISGSTCVYVSCRKEDRPRDIARRAVEQWHSAGYLWESFKRAFVEFSEGQSDPLLAPDAVRELFKAFPKAPDRLPLSRYTHSRDHGKIANAFASWASNKVKTSAPSLVVLADSYLSAPSEFCESIKGKSIDSIALYEGCSRFLASFGYNRHYVFFDQFEDMIMGTTKAGMGKFALDMKGIVRASSGAVSIFVTLHPDSENRLRLQTAQDMTGVAPLDTVHRIDVMILDTKGHSSIPLAEEYFKHFRVGDSPYPTYPVEPELLEFMCYLERGLIRRFLQLLHNALAFGIGNGYPELTMEYARTHSTDILGKEVDQKTIDDFNAHRGRPVAPEPTGRSWGGAVKGFKETSNPP